MGNVIGSTLTIILSVQFMIGNVGNGFIALVNGIDWAKRRKISSADRILTALAISRIGQLWSVFTNWCLSVFNPLLVTSGKVFRTLHATWVVTNHFSIWLATCLSVFYFFKIANFSNSAFLYLKWRVKKVISVGLLVTLVPLAFNVALTTTHINVLFSECNRNMTCSSSFSNLPQFVSLLLIINSMFTFIPFAVTLTTFLLLIFSLWKHLRTMQRDAQGPRDASTKAHITALQSVITFLLLYAILFLSYFIPVLISYSVNENLILMISQTTAITFPSGHSCVLILGNNKLRQAFLSGPWGLRWMFKRRDPWDQHIYQTLEPRQVLTAEPTSIRLLLSQFMNSDPAKVTRRFVFPKSCCSDKNLKCFYPDYNGAVTRVLKKLL
ncbi:taste receptor type 2 member 14-like [Tupaia chinensis]|uniref:taste receptor type 2 member 14-like n=1 Tax=Tupaia chinensis TaxID=246437 RepID=UPI0003C8D8CD|nr:taste receptor type 2 member 14-like [Tupaia chinensis]